MLTPDQYKKMTSKDEDKGKLSTKEALKAMGHYFELDEKKVHFFITQLELSKKI